MFILLTMNQNLLAQEPAATGIPVWLWVVLGIILVAIILGLVLGSRTAERDDTTVRSKNPNTDMPIPQTGPVVEETPTMTTSDTGARVYDSPLETPGVESSESVENSHDLTVIEGIGPGVQQVLNGAGIYTYDQLARTNPDQLRNILRKSGLRFDDPADWPQQAEMAARGNYDGFDR